MSAEILIVDDNADIRNIINELIIDAGYKTRIAANYNQALAEIDKKLPDVAILDVKLDKGDNDGIELLSHIKTKNKDVPVIIISGHANIEMAVKSLQHGAFEFIEKPFNQERLLNFINRAVENINLINKNKEFGRNYIPIIPDMRYSEYENDEVYWLKVEKKGLLIFLEREGIEPANKYEEKR